MANCTLQLARGAGQLARGAGIRHAGAMAVALALGVAGLAGPAAAQQPAPAPAPKKAPAAAPAQKGAPTAPAAAAGAPQSAWVKLCEKATAVGKDKDGKEEKKELNICLTIHERIDGNSGMVMVSAALRQVEGQDKQLFMVMVPLGMMIAPGIGLAIYAKDLWEKVSKNEQIDESKLKRVGLKYTLCHPGGCTAEIEATPEFIGEIKAAGGLAIFAVDAAGRTAVFPVPLVGFDQAYAGAPVDNKQYTEARKAVMQQIVQRKQEAYNKQQEEAQKAGQTPGAAPPAPPPTKAAAPAPAQKK